MSRLRRHTISLGHALDGVFYVARTQPNFQVHLVAAMIVTLTGIMVHLSRLEWVIIVFTIMVVLVAETVNTSLESVTDLLTDQYHLEAKIVKDVSAGMVLITAFTSVIIGLFIFIPHLF